MRFFGKGRPISPLLQTLRGLPAIWQIATLTWLFAFCGPVSWAHAGGKQRAVPDLRRDAARWTEGGRTGAVGLRLPLTVHIAVEPSGDPVVDHRRVRRWVRRANLDLAAAGIAVEITSVRLLPEGWDAITRWRQRRLLASYAPRDGTIHVFVTSTLDTKRQRVFHRQIRGLHWRYRGISRELRDREYVVVTQNAPVTTFGHELGHLFGLGHSNSPTNIMCSCRSGDRMSFTSEQSVAMRQGVRRFELRQTVTSRRARWADRARR